MGGRLFLAAVFALGSVLAAPSPAQASFHEILVREVYPGSAAKPDSAYVVLQMYAAGQQLVGGHGLTTYGAGGAATGTFSFTGDLPNGANQQTILVGDNGVQSALGVTPDLSNASFAIDPAGGAVCWEVSLDCVSWGSFGGSTPSPSGSPADPLGIPDGKALRRTIAPGCSTLLQPGDDSNVSVNDLFDATPQPRNNASPISEEPCTGPVTMLDSKPANPTNATGASFTYHATPTAAGFECRLDAASFASCAPSGVEYSGPLGVGFHTFQIRAENAMGSMGDVVSYTWRIDTTAPTTTIDSHPADRSPGASAAFTFHASEAGSSFRCSLVHASEPDSFSACTSGKTYANLADGDYTFKVFAKDLAGNEGLATSFDWTVDNSVVVTPPAGGQPPPPVAPVASPPAQSVTPPLRRRRHHRRRCRRGKPRQGKARAGKRCQRKSHSRNRATASTFHLVLVREVYPGSSAKPDAQYVELQMYSAGQEFVQGHKVEFFGPTGASLGTATFDSNLAHGANQSTILVATGAAEEQFGVVADKGIPTGMLAPGGGAVCWESLDCVAWGSFSGAPGSPVGSPASPFGIADGTALRRTIAPGCPTLLEPADDRDDSATDFAEVAPAPRPNSTTPSEQPCGAENPYGGPGNGPGAGGRGRRPRTRLGRHPAKVTHDRTPTFAFRSSRAHSTFLCKLDSHPFRRCRSPFTTRRLKLGSHVFRVKARAPGGAIDRTPAIWGFTVSEQK